MGIIEFIQTERLILLDGAMGTLLDKYGSNNPGGQDNLLNPNLVLRVHSDYLSCGAHMIITNTLTMNRIYIEHHRLPVDPMEVNIAGAKLAKQTIGANHYILGDISSTGQLLEPYGTYSKAQFCKAYEEQALALAEGGVDGFIVETMYDLREALCAVKSCQNAAPHLPIFVTMTFSTLNHGGRTIMGDSVETCIKSLTDYGVQAVGTNCGDLDPLEIAEIVSTISSLTTLPIIAQPNAGKARLIDGKTVFTMNPEVFREGMVKCIQNGAKIIGGCCGTTPEHIRAISQIRNL